MPYVCCMIEFVYSVKSETTRDRHKQAPYLRLKNSKRTSKCQIFFCSAWKCQVFFYSTKVEPNWRAKRGTLSDFLTSIAVKYQILKKTEGPWTLWVLKNSHNDEKN